MNHSLSLYKERVGPRPGFEPGSGDPQSPILTTRPPKSSILFLSCKKETSCVRVSKLDAETLTHSREFGLESQSLPELDFIQKERNIKLVLRYSKQMLLKKLYVRNRLNAEALYL